MISAVMPTYGRWDVAVDRGEGPYLWATDGRKFLDFTSGIAVTGLGHCHPHLVGAVTEQAKRLWHTSNLFQIPGQERLAQRLVDNTFADTVFFGNSGAEACELAIKVARKYQSETGHPERYRIVACEGSFHGRTLATLAAGGQKKYLEGFGPVVEGFDQVPFADLNAVKKAIGNETAAIMVEPLMGEGGLRTFEPSFLRALREICDQNGLLLIFDEVQTGMGRTGELFAYQRAGVAPDVMTLAKALAGGVPVGAVLATSEAAKGMTPGTHGSTFGGNPLAMSAANATLDVMLAPGFLDHVKKIGILFKQRLAEIKDRYPELIAEVRGEGLLVGLRAVIPAGELINAIRAEKMLTLTAGDNVVRLVPPLIISEQEMAEGIARLDRACARLSRSVAPAAAASRPKEEAAG